MDFEFACWFLGSSASAFGSVGRRPVSNRRCGGAGANDGRTIFAPTNEALLAACDDNDNGNIESSEIPSDASDVLQYHVHDNALRAGDIPSDTTVSSLEGTDLTISGGDAVTVNPGDENAGVTVPDVVVDNGVIHGIDAVLTP